MLKHIVMWKLNESEDNSSMIEIIKRIKDELMSLKSKIDVILDLEVGVNVISNEQSYDLCLNSSFKDEHDLLIYQNHKDHQLFVQFIKQVTTSRVVIDYFI